MDQNGICKVCWYWTGDLEKGLTFFKKGALYSNPLQCEYFTEPDYV